MIFYLVPAVDGHGPQKLEPTQADANRVAKERGLKVRAPQMQIDIPTDKTGLMAYINSLMAIEVKVSPAITVEDIPEADESFFERAELRLPSDKPAFTQAQVDAMFTSIDEKALPDVDTVCHAIATFEGAAIGHVAHELAARIQRLGSAVANG